MILPVLLFIPLFAQDENLFVRLGMIDIKASATGLFHTGYPGNFLQTLRDVLNIVYILYLEENENMKHHSSNRS